VHVEYRGEEMTNTRFSLTPVSTVDNYAETVRSGLKELWESFLATLIILFLMATLILMGAGVISELSNDSLKVDPYGLLMLPGSGVDAIATLIPRNLSFDVLGVLATISIAQTVSARSLFEEVRELPQSDTVDDSTRAYEIERASKLQKIVSTAVMFSLFLTSSNVIFSLAMFKSGNVIAGTVSILLGLFLSLESIRFIMSRREIGEFRVDISGRSEVAFRVRTESVGTAKRWRLVYCGILLLCLFLPYAYTKGFGYDDSAGEILITTIVIWLLYFSFFTCLAREHVDRGRMSRLFARFICIVMAFIMFAFNGLLVLVSFENDHVAYLRVVILQLCATAIIAIILLLGVLGETRWLLLKGFGVEYARDLCLPVNRKILLRAVAYWRLSRRSFLFLVQILIPLLAVPFVLVLVAKPASMKAIPVISLIAAVVIVVCGVARWGHIAERVGAFGGAVLLLVSGCRQAAELFEVSLDFVSVGFGVALIIMIAITWDRSKTLPLMGPLLCMVDVVVANRMLRFSRSV